MQFYILLLYLIFHMDSGRFPLILFASLFTLLLNCGDFSLMLKLLSFLVLIWYNLKCLDSVLVFWHVTVPVSCLWGIVRCCSKPKVNHSKESFWLSVKMVFEFGGSIRYSCIKMEKWDLLKLF
jgi:hypothetical protein